MSIFNRPLRRTQAPTTDPNLQVKTEKAAEELVEKTNDVAKNVGKKGGSHTMMNTTAGLIVGATFGGIAGAMLSDEQTRKTVGEKLAQFAKTATETAAHLNDHAYHLKSHTGDSIDAVEETTKKM